MDTGGLAQMSYNQFAANGLGMPGAGFASRGKASGLKRLSVASPPTIASISEHGGEAVHTPRTSRSHLLAGLRTQPKTTAVPASAPYNQTQHRFGLDPSRYTAQGNSHGGHGSAQNVPHTAIGSSFPNAVQQYNMGNAQQVYSLPEQVLAPPEIDYAAYQGNDQVDPALAQQLMATKLHLAQRQAQLQQQLLSLSGGMQGMNLNMGAHTSHQVPQPPMTAHTSLYYQQLQNGVSPVVQEIQGRPGVYLVYNPLTGQQSIFNSQAQQVQLASSPPPATSGAYSTQHMIPDTPVFRAEVSPPIDTSRNSNPFDNTRSISPPKKTASPPSDMDVTPLPPPSAGAFRRSQHKKVSSLAFDHSVQVVDGPKSAFVRPVGFPQTPMTGTFGPGNARAGEHPTRQPRGPPSLEELVAAPTTKHEGSKNFATRQRRGAVRSLVRAGIERRTSGRQNSLDSNDVASTPVSETEVVYSVPSDGEDSATTGSLSGRPSFGSLRTASNNAIGSEMKLRKSSNSSISSGSGDLLAGLGKDISAQRMRSPMMLAAPSVNRVGGVY